MTIGPPLESPIRVTGKISAEDFVEAHNLFETAWRKATWIFALVLVTPAIVVQWIIWRNSGLTPERATLYTVCEAGVIVLICGLVKVCSLPWQRRKLRRLAASFEDCDISISEAGITTHRDQDVQEQSWSTFAAFRRSEQVVVLIWAGPRIVYQSYSRAMFRNAGDWERFLDLLERKLPRL